MPIRLNIEGQVYGKLTVICKAETNNKTTYWKCKCQCGNYKDVSTRNLRMGDTKSCGCLHKLKCGVSAFNSLYSDYKYRAKIKKFQFDIDIESFKNITSSNCFYCGVEPKNISTERNSGSYIYNGLDRIDNLKGYTIENVVACCKYCNSAKKDMSIKDFLEWINRVHSNYSIIKEKLGGSKNE